jgi:hypothetical protein
MKSVGFKEWAIVCEALGDGRQSVILRKGGIAEGRDGFAFRHSEFFLFPTFFHEQAEKTRISQPILPQPNESQIDIRFFAKVEHACRIDSWEIAAALESLHILQESIVRERFNCDRTKGLHVAFARVFRLEPNWILPNERSYAGCCSWIQLPDSPAEIQLKAVLNDAQHAEIQKRFLTVINQGRAISKSPIGGLETAAP